MYHCQRPLLGHWFEVIQQVLENSTGHWSVSLNGKEAASAWSR